MSPPFLATMNHPNQEQIALGIQQPWAELILRGLKTIEVRNVPVGMRTTIYLYSSKRFSSLADARTALETYGIELAELPLGQIVGTIDIVGCRPCLEEDVSRSGVSWELMKSRYSWILENPQRCSPPMRPNWFPYGMWFYPFKPRNSDLRERS